MISKDDLFDAYTRYCISARAFTLSRNVFFTKLNTAVITLQDAQAGNDSDRERMIAAIGLRDFDDHHEEVLV
ncbi:MULTISPECIES: hypothetical protein [unclassified Bradyrhizobium]